MATVRLIDEQDAPEPVRRVYERIKAGFGAGAECLQGLRP